jgi:hypothetical protein
MTALTTSNRLFGFNSAAAPPGRLAKNETLPRDCYWRIELRRSLSRWENEGGAIYEEENAAPARARSTS